MIFRTSRKAAAALLLSGILTLTCAAPSQAFGWLSRPTADGPGQIAWKGGILHFLRRIFAFSNGTMDPNGQH
jgi:hypothetical protein